MATGNRSFWDLLHRRSEPRFLAFDLLWYKGKDLRFAPLTERKHTLRSVLPANSERIMYCDHVEQDGERLFRLARENDLGGIVAKRKFDPYLPNQASWLKIRNTNYSQGEGREELLNQERETDLDLSLGDDCARGCDSIAWEKCRDEICSHADQ